MCDKYLSLKKHKHHELLTIFRMYSLSLIALVKCNCYDNVVSMICLYIIIFPLKKTFWCTTEQLSLMEKSIEIYYIIRMWKKKS